MTVSTNTGTEEQVRASMGIEPEGQESDVADAGGETASADGADERADEQPRADAVAAPVEDKPRKSNPRNNPQARIAQEIEKRKAVESRAAELEAQLNALRAQPAKVEKVDTPAPVVRAKPKEEEVGTKYQTYADFIEDLADWKAEQRLGAVKPANLDELVEQKLAQREQQRQQSQAMDAHLGRVAAVREQHDDYDDKVSAADQALAAAGLTLSEASAKAILGSEHSGSLVYWLATHPTEYLQLARDTQSLGVAAVPLVRQLLEARLGAVASPGSAHSAQISRAKPPIKPVGASPLAPLSEDASDDEPFEKFFARENSRDRKAGRL